MSNCASFVRVANDFRMSVQSAIYWSSNCKIYCLENHRLKQRMEPINLKLIIEKKKKNSVNSTNKTEDGTKNLPIIPHF